MTDRYQPHDLVWTPERVAHIWEYYGTNPAYDDAYFSKHSGRSVLRFIQKQIPLDGRQVLDFGSGRGHMLQHLLAEGITCQGLEFSSESADLAEETIGAHPLFGGVVRTQAVPTPVPDESVDVVLLIEVIEHLFEEQIAPTLQDIQRILRPGGHLVATTPHAENFALNMVHCPECGATFHRWQHMRSMTVAGMSGMMAGAGFQAILCQPTYFKSARGRVGHLLFGLGRLLSRVRGKEPHWPHLVYIGRKS